jgi:transposase
MAAEQDKIATLCQAAAAKREAAAARAEAGYASSPRPASPSPSARLPPPAACRWTPSTATPDGGPASNGSAATSPHPQIDDRIIFEKLVQMLRFGCSYASIADCACSATTIRGRRDEWIEAGIFARLNQIAAEAYDRIVGLVLQEILIDGCITKAPGGGECAGRSPWTGGNRE